MARLLLRCVNQQLIVLGRVFSLWLWVLQFDIEGYEWKLLLSLLPKLSEARRLLQETGIQHLPQQMSFEMHYKPTVADTYLPSNAAYSIAEISLYWERLFDAGYRTISREDNRFCKVCTEFTVMRTMC